MDSLMNVIQLKIGEKRFNHTLGVVDTALKLSKTYNCDEEKVEIAALLHDCAKYKDRLYLLKMANDFDIILDDTMKYEMELIHGPLGAKIAKETYKIDDIDILNAIEYHSTGRENMSLLEKIIYIADYIEPGRSFPGVEEIRELAFIDLDKALLLAMDNTISFLISKRGLIHLNTINARNFMIKQLKEKNKEGDD